MTSDTIATPQDDIGGHDVGVSSVPDASRSDVLASRTIQVREDGKWTTAFRRVPTWLARELEDGHLTKDQFALLLYLALAGDDREGEGIAVSYSQLADLFECGHKTMQRMIRHLEESHFINTTRKPGREMFRVVLGPRLRPDDRTTDMSPKYDMKDRSRDRSKTCPGSDTSSDMSSDTDSPDESSKPNNEAVNGAIELGHKVGQKIGHEENKSLARQKEKETETDTKTKPTSMLGAKNLSVEGKREEQSLKEDSATVNDTREKSTGVLPAAGDPLEPFLRHFPHGVTEWSRQTWERLILGPPPMHKNLIEAAAELFDQKITDPDNPPNDPCKVLTKLLQKQRNIQTKAAALRENSPAHDGDMTALEYELPTIGGISPGDEGFPDSLIAAFEAGKVTLAQAMELHEQHEQASAS